MSDLCWLEMAFSFLLGWNLNGLCWQLAYKFGIVEYKGLKK